MGGSTSRAVLLLAKLVPDDPGAASNDAYTAPPDCAARLDSNVLWTIETTMSAGCGHVGGGWTVTLMPVLAVPGGAAGAGDADGDVTACPCVCACVRV